METSNKQIIYDGRIMPADAPAVPVVSRGLMYGDGVFETMRVYRGKTFLFEDHIDRLRSGMRTLGLPLKTDLEVEALKEMIWRLLEKQKLLDSDAIVRLQVWRGGDRGYHPQKDSQTHFSITAGKCPGDYKNPILKTVSINRIPSQSLPSEVKLTNGINYILAAREAADRDGDDALMQTIDGYISETTIANIFWIKEKTIFTPDTNCDLIPGITRKTILDIIKKNRRWKVESGKYALGHILEADAVWLCNSVREVLAVQKINDQNYSCDHPAISTLQDRYRALIQAGAKPLT